MSSPVTGEDFVVATPGQSFCDRITNLLSLSSKMKLWFDWAFKTDGTASQEFKAQFLPYPYTIWPIYLSGTESSAKTAIEALGRPDGDEVTEPFWRLCDGTNGTPDLRGRTIIGAGAGTGLTGRALGAIGGSEKHVLTTGELPDLTEKLSTVKFEFAFTTDDGGGWNALTPANEAVWGFVGDEGKGGADGDISFSHANARIRVPENTADPDPAVGHENMPPFVAVWYMMRTTRLE